MSAPYAPVLDRIRTLLSEKKNVIEAIDGRSRKSSLAALLAEHFPCNVFHMDDPGRGSADEGSGGGYALSGKTRLLRPPRSPLPK